MKSRFVKRLFYLTLLLSATCLLLCLCAAQEAALEEVETALVEETHSGKCSIKPQDGDACHGGEDAADGLDGEAAEVEEENLPEDIRTAAAEADTPEAVEAPVAATEEEEGVPKEEEEPTPHAEPAMTTEDAPAQSAAAAVEAELVAEKQQEETAPPQAREAEVEVEAEAAPAPYSNAAKEARLRAEGEMRMREEEARQAEERRQRPERTFTEGPASIQMRARVHPDGCIVLTKKYYAARRGREALVQKVRDSRAAFNEAVARGPKAVPKLQKELARAQQQLEDYDTTVLQTYGADLPRTCIEEVQAEVEAYAPPDSENLYVGQFYQFYALIRAHVRLLELSGRGLYEHLLESRFRPAQERLASLRSGYVQKAEEVYKNAGGTEDPLTLTQLAVRYYAYLSVPYLVLGSTVALLVIFFPYLLIDVVVRTFMLNLWARVLLYYLLGFTSLRAYLGAVKDTVLVLVSGDYVTALHRCLNAFLDLMIDHFNFFNFMVLSLVFSGVLVVLFILVRLWLGIFIYPLLRTRRPKTQARK